MWVLISACLWCLFPFTSCVAVFLPSVRKEREQSQRPPLTHDLSDAHPLNVSGRRSTICSLSLPFHLNRLLFISLSLTAPHPPTHRLPPHHPDPDEL